MKKSIALTLLLLSSCFAYSDSFTQDDARWHNLGDLTRFPKTAASSQEWFYFDAQDPIGGTQVVVIFLAPNALDVTPEEAANGQGSLGHVGVAVQAYAPGIGELPCYDYVKDPTALTYTEENSGRNWDLKIGGTGARMTERPNGLRDYKLSLNLKCRVNGKVVGSVTGWLAIQGKLPGWKSGDGYIFNQDEKYNYWVVPMPLGVANGEVKIDLLSPSGEQHAVNINVKNNDSFHDHSISNSPHFAAAEGYLWGRAVTKTGKVMTYVKVFGRQNTSIPGTFAGPDSVRLFMHDGNNTVIDTRDAELEMGQDFYSLAFPIMGDENMRYPAEYTVRAINSPYRFHAKLPEFTTTSAPYYLRQHSQMIIENVETGETESADLVNDQIDYASLFKFLSRKSNP